MYSRALIFSSCFYLVEGTAFGEGATGRGGDGEPDTVGAGIVAPAPAPLLAGEPEAAGRGIGGVLVPGAGAGGETEDGVSDCKNCDGGNVGKGVPAIGVGITIGGGEDGACAITGTAVAAPNSTRSGTTTCLLFNFNPPFSRVRCYKPPLFQR